MCTKEETAEILNQEFWKKDGLKDQLISEVHKAIDARIGRWLIGGGVAILFVVFSAWFTLNNQVSNNTDKLEKALTQDQAALLIQRIDQLSEANKDLNDTIKSLDDRLRNKGI